MSVLVKGMKMPENCDECPVGEYEDSEWFACSLMNVAHKHIAQCDRLDDCPLIEISQNHGRLFDETEVKKCLQELPDSDDKWGAIALLEWAIEKRWCIEAEVK